MCKSCPVIDWEKAIATVASFGGAPKLGGVLSNLIVWYDRYDRSQKGLVGGKNASLGELMMADLPVPPGFAITTDAYQQIWANHDLVAEINQELAGLDHTDLVANMEVSTRIRKRIEDEPVPAATVDAIGASYRALADFCSQPDVPVAVRSSATAEDLPDASFAGQQDTFLWVKGEEAVMAAVRRCWSSLFTDRAIAYRHAMGFLHHSISMAVGIQKMVDPVAAGVAFTLNPSNGDRSQVAIDASWGLGEAVVSGEVTPDNFLVDKVIREVVSRRISDKEFEYCLDEDGTVVKAAVPDDRRRQACVSDDDLRNICALARRAEKHYGCPQDVEWAIDRHLPEGFNVVLLQSRPETVWSRVPCKPIGATKDPVRSIISTLSAPIHTR
ncbi:MAG: PEP/pyruvate-binding domain-containing protein [Acidobacteriota bacterium]|nr:PEP/pyruvate-binding domain-containing protein [Acidobacteriota bacterium]